MCEYLKYEDFQESKVQVKTPQKIPYFFYSTLMFSQEMILS